MLVYNERGPKQRAPRSPYEDMTSDVSITLTQRVAVLAGFIMQQCWRHHL